MLIITESENFVETSTALIGAGADLNLCDSYGWTPLMAAASS